MKSFIVSYEAATLLNTPATAIWSIGYAYYMKCSIIPRASFSASGTVSKPKWVVLSWFEGCDGDSVRRADLEKHRGDRAGRYCGFEARSNGLIIDLKTIMRPKRGRQVRGVLRLVFDGNWVEVKSSSASRPKAEDYHVLLMNVKVNSKLHVAVLGENSWE
jgi:hypothetical protein